MQKSLLNQSALVRAALILFTLCLLFQSATKVSNAQTFAVSGNKILRDGQEFVVKGANVNGPGWGWGKATAPDVVKLLDLWKFNTVRVNIVLKKGRYVGENEDLAALVRAFTTDRISAGKTPAVVMLEVHDATGTYFNTSSVPNEEPTLTEARDWWVARANEYKGNSNVWFNIANEPGGGTQVMPEWMTMHDTITSAIRATGASNIVVCDGTNWATEGAATTNATISTADSAILTYGPTLQSRYGNVTFAYHVYHQFNENTVPKMRDFVDRVHAANLCVMVGEWGQTAFNPLESVTATTGMFNVIRGQNAKGVQVGRIVWHWYGGDDNKLTNFTDSWTPGNGEYIDRTDGTRPTNMSWIGELAWDDNHNAPLIIDNQPTPLSRTGWTATGSETQRGNANNVLDGKYGGQYGGDWNAYNWIPGGVFDGQWIQVDMQSAKTFNEIRLKGQYGTWMPRGWKVYVSNDANNPGVAVQTFASANSEVRLRLTNPATGRYLRIETTGGNYYTGWWALNELDVYNGASATIANGIYKITSRADGRVMDAYGSGNGGTVGVWAWNGNSNQRWQVESAGSGTYTLKEMRSGMILDDFNNGTIGLWSYWGGVNQKWRLVPTDSGFYRLENVGTGKAVGVASSLLKQEAYTGANSQQWKVELP